MAAAQLGTLLLTWFIAVVSPGPDLVMVLHQSLTRSRRAGLWAGAGVVTGIAVWLCAAFLGLSALLHAVPWLLVLLQLAGGLLLAYLGAGSLRAWAASRRRTTPPADSGTPGTVGAAPRADSPGVQEPQAGQGSASGAYRRGLATNLANPKALVFFGAILAPFLSGDLQLRQSAGIIAVMLAIALAWFGFLALVATSAPVRPRIQALQAMLDFIAGALFVAIGAGFVAVALAEAWTVG